jgi:hypothetical protein
VTTLLTRAEAVHIMHPNVAKFALIGLVYIYTSKLISTLFLGIFRSAAFTGIIVGLTILAGIAQFVFFIALYKYYVTRPEKNLQHAGLLAIIGSAIGLVPKLLALAVLFQHQPLFFLIRHASRIGAFCPWLSAFFLLASCSIVLLEPDMRRITVLKRAFIAGAAGWLIIFATHSLVLINYINAGQLVWLGDLINNDLIIFLITSTAAFICLFIFYQTFIKTDLFNQC